jgi:hypothetical protein
VDDDIFGDEDFRPQRAPPRRMIRVHDVVRELRTSATFRTENEAALVNALENGLPIFWEFRRGDVVVQGHQPQDDDAFESDMWLQAHGFTVVEGRRHRLSRNAGPRSYPDLDNDSLHDTNNAGDDVLCKHRDLHASRTERHHRRIRLPTVRRTLRRMLVTSRTAYQIHPRRRPRR